MGVPPTTARSTPVGDNMGDGYQTLIAFEDDPDVSFWEKTVTPPGVDGGDEVENTTMHNTVWRTMSSRTLKSLTEVTIVAAYDPRVYDQIVALINVEGGITVHFPDASTLDFWGYLKTFEPGENVEGTQPEATITIVPTNTDPDDGTEAGPNYVSPTGTD